MLLPVRNTRVIPIAFIANIKIAPDMPSMIVNANSLIPPPLAELVAASSGLLVCFDNICYPSHTNGDLK